MVLNLLVFEAFFLLFYLQILFITWSVSFAISFVSLIHFFCKDLLKLFAMIKEIFVTVAFKEAVPPFVSLLKLHWILKIYLKLWTLSTDFVSSSCMIHLNQIADIIIFFAYMLALWWIFLLFKDFQMNFPFYDQVKIDFLWIYISNYL